MFSHTCAFAPVLPSACLCDYLQLPLLQKWSQNKFAPMQQTLSPTQAHFFSNPCCILYTHHSTARSPCDSVSAALRAFPPDHESFRAETLPVAPSTQRALWIECVHKTRWLSSIYSCCFRNNLCFSAFFLYRVLLVHIRENGGTCRHWTLWNQPGSGSSCDSAAPSQLPAGAPAPAARGSATSNLAKVMRKINTERVR